MAEPQIESTITVGTLLKILKRRILYIVLPMLIVTPLVSLWAWRLPDLYESSATILITPQKVPVAYVRSTVTTDIGDRIDIIVKQMLSYDRLNQLIDSFNLYPEMVETKTRQEIFYRVVGDINITPEESLTRNKGSSPGKAKAIDSFRISYRGTSPRTVAAVANKLTSIFIEENLREREQLAVGTSDFLTKELEQAKNLLSQQEARIAEYKKEYRGQLPSELKTNLSKLDRNQGFLTAISGAMSAEEDRRIILKQIIGEMQSASSGDDPYQRLQDLNALLSALQASNYTDKHPDLVATKREMALIKAKIERDRENPASASSGLRDPALVQANQELAASKLRSETLLEREELYRGKVKEVELLIEETPKRQEELSTLERDLRMMHRQYEGLLVKMQNARMAENLERKQKGEQFRVLNTAQIPTNPIEPNRSKLILFSFFLSFMFGMALGVLVEVSDHSLRDSASAQSLIGLPMLATIPKLVLDTERVRKAVLRRSILITASTMGVLMVGSLGLLFLIRTGRLG